MDPLLDQIVHAKFPVQPHILKLWQQRLPAEIQPQLDRLADLERENAALREQLGRKAPKKDAVPA